MARRDEFCYAAVPGTGQVFDKWRSMASSPHDDLEALELALVGQWANFGRGPGGSFYDDGELAWTEAPVAQLPYNAIVKTRLTHDVEDRIDAMVRHFQSRGVQFLWIVHPSVQPANLAQLLPRHGLSLVAREQGMALDLASWQAPATEPGGPISYRAVSDERSLRDFEDLIARYWDLSNETRPYVDACIRRAFETGDRGAWMLAYKEDEPVGKVYLSTQGLDDTASIWGVYVTSAARGYGVGSGLTELALKRAVDLGKSRVVLASSEMGLNLYRRIGFKETRELAVYASASFPKALQGAQPV